MRDNNGYWEISCRFPIENKRITIELPPDTEFLLNIFASKNGISPEKLAETIIKNYINNNCKNKPLEKYFK